MILISHRGNINGKNTQKEHHPSYIDEAIEAGYNVEIDVWCLGGRLFLGHDSGDYIVDINWLENRSSKLWIHCKNYEAVEYFKDRDSWGDDLNYFWHQNDDLTLTSKNIVWAYPGKQPIKHSIAVLPEIHNDDVTHCIGICSDIIENYKDESK